MAVKNNKDPNRTETIRFYDGDDKNYHTVLNRTVEDLEQRDNDLDQIFTPARGARARARIPNDTQVEVEPYVFVNGTTITQKTTVTTLSAVPATGTPGNVRKDLVYLRLDTNTVIRLAGTEAANFAAASVPNLPSGIPAVPLAALYVDDVPANFSDQTAIDVAGHIEDLRPAPGTGFPFFEDNSSNILSDATSASLGSTNRVARSNHQHPLNVDATLPNTIQAGDVALAGTSVRYARIDHEHAIATESSAAVLRTDVSGGNVGTALTFARADHRHPLNAGATIPPVDGGTGTAGVSGVYAREDHQHPLNVPSSGLPATVGPSIAGSLGVASTYSRSDHVHPMQAPQVSLQSASWVSESGAKPFNFGFTPDFVIVIGAFAGIASDTPGAWVGFTTGVSAERSVGWLVDVGGDSNRMGMGARSDRVGYMPTNFIQPAGGGADSAQALWDVISYGSTVQISASVTVTGNAYALGYRVR